MTNLKLIKSENFGEVQADIYSNDKGMYMTAFQLGECLGYMEPMRSVNRIVSRNDYLRDEEFSVVVKLTTTDGKAYNTRVFTEDGMYEVSMLSRTDKAKEFRSWVRKVLRGLRTGEMEVMAKPMTQAEILAMQANLLVDLEGRIEDISSKLDNALHTLATPTCKSWQSEMQTIIGAICTGNGLSLPMFRHKLYSELESSARCNLSARQRCHRERLKKAGATCQECRDVTKLDVIERDEKLKLIFDSIVKKYQVKYMV